MNRAWLLGGLLCLLNHSWCGADEPVTPEVDRAALKERLSRNLATLASDSLEGREAGRRGGHAAAALIIGELKKTGLKPAGDAGQWLQEFGPQYRNVLALRPGSDPDLQDECIVIGAHFDHVGLGNSSNSFGPYGMIHNGADDNASGTSALLEIARQLGADAPQKRPILVAFWDAEEVALLGSAHWLRSSLRRPVRLYINVDMIGRLRNSTLHTMGWRSAAGLRSQLTAANGDGALKLAFQPRVIADSDHWPFYSQRIPAISFDTGKHEDYHRPSDDANRISIDGVAQITLFAERLVRAAANETEKLTFRADAFTEQTPQFAANPVNSVPRLGIVLDPRALPQGIVQVQSVRAESPAARAGLQSGDRITRFGSWEGGTVAAFRSVVQLAKPETEVRFQRPGERAVRSGQIRLQSSRVKLGVAVQTDSALGRGVWIAQVVAGSPADLAGLRPGDVVYTLNGTPVNTFEEFNTARETGTAPWAITGERRGQPREWNSPAVVTEPQAPATASAPESTDTPGASPPP